MQGTANYSPTVEHFQREIPKPINEYAYKYMSKQFEERNIIIIIITFICLHAGQIFLSFSAVHMKHTKSYLMTSVNVFYPICFIF